MLMPHAAAAYVSRAIYYLFFAMMPAAAAAIDADAAASAIRLPLRYAIYAMPLTVFRLMFLP